MLKKFNVFVLIYFFLCFSAEACQLSNIFNFSVYASNDISAHSSDFQGLTGAGGSINVRHFRFGPLGGHECGIGVSVAKSFNGEHGSMDGILEMTNPKATYYLGDKYGYSSFTVSKVVSSSHVHHPTVIQHMHDMSNHYASLNVTKDVKVEDAGELKFITGAEKIQVIELNNQQFFKNKNIRLIGKSNQTVIINVEGAFVNIHNLTLNVLGVKIRNIVWNFHQARSLKMNYIAGYNTLVPLGAGPYDPSLGWQGYIFAPHADIYLEEMKLTGAVYGKNILTSSNLSTAQVNLPPL